MTRLTLSLTLSLLCLTGCPREPFGGLRTNLSTTGSAIDQTKAHIQAAEQGVQAAKPHADATGVAILGLVSQQHDAAQKTADAGSAALGKALTDAEKIAKRNADLVTANAKLEHSIGHRVQVWLTRLFWIVVGLFIFHCVGVLVAAFLPPPWNLIVGGAAKIVNPAGWFVWIASKIEQRHAVAAAVAPGIFPIPIAKL